MGIVERLVPNELWELFQRVVPEAPSRLWGGGRRRHGDREVLAAIVFVPTSGCTWQQLPTASFGPSGATAHRRFSEWSKARVRAKLHRVVLDELGARGPAGAVWVGLEEFKTSFAGFHDCPDSHVHTMMGQLFDVDGDKANAFGHGTWILVREAA